MTTLAREIEGMALPEIEQSFESDDKNPFHILISTLLSARTQDATTLAASERLFKAAATPAELARLPIRRIEKLIFPVGFYRNKARFVKAASKAIVDTFDGRVPQTLEEMVTLPGVGRKTASLVMIVAFQSQRHICVDIHVHRISNRLGWVKTKTPEETEQALYKAVDARWWPLLNLHLVTWGQNICRPVNPRCDRCAIRPDCRRIGVKDKT